MNHLPGKTLAQGLSKTRRGSPSIGIHKLIELGKQAGFEDRLKQAVSDEGALDAARQLTEGGRGRKQRYAEAGAIGGALAPGITLGGNVAKNVARFGFKGKALQAAARASFSKPHVASDVARGVLGGAAFQAGREGLQLHHAKKTVDEFIKERRGD